MLAYRHAFHAGNHADVFKHAVMLYCLDYLQQKPGALQVVDTHAGAGLYSPEARLVRDKAEFNTGLGRLWPMKREGMPALVADYLEAVSVFNPEPTLTCIPGSPVLLVSRLREKDLLRAFEVHPTDFPLLESALADYGRRVKAEKADGFERLRGLLPPVSRRGFVVIDPPFELKGDYAKTMSCLRDGLGRFATGCFLVWIPMLQRFEVERFLRQSAALPVDDKLLISLRVRSPLQDGLGLLGSHLLVINPPFGLEAACRQALPWLVRQLGQDDSAHFEIQTLKADPSPLTDRHLPSAGRGPGAVLDRKPKPARAPAKPRIARARPTNKP